MQNCEYVNKSFVCCGVRTKGMHGYGPRCGRHRNSIGYDRCLVIKHDGNICFQPKYMDRDCCGDCNHRAIVRANNKKRRESKRAKPAHNSAGAGLCVPVIADVAGGEEPARCGSAEHPAAG